MKRGRFYSQVVSIEYVEIDRIFEYVFDGSVYHIQWLKMLLYLRLGTA